MDERQLMLMTLEEEEKGAIALLEKRNKELKSWKEWHLRELPVHETRISSAEQTLKDVQRRIEEAKKEKNPAKAFSVSNKQRADDDDLRYFKGCAVNDPDVASLIETFDILMADRFGLPLIKSGEFAGHPFVKALLSQLICNALMIPLDKLRYVSPQEISAALRSWPKKS